MKKIVQMAVVVMVAMIATQTVASESHGKKNKVLFRGAWSHLTGNRGNEVFTDTNGATTVNNDKSGFSVAGGLELGMTDQKALLNTFSLAGELFVEFSRFANASVTQATSALLGAATTSTVDVTELNVGINPKVRIDKWGKFRPFIIPVGLAFLVVSPPSDDTTYLDLGVNFGVGADYEINNWLSLGVDVRYAHGFELNNTNTSYLSAGGFVGLMF